MSCYHEFGTQIQSVTANSYMVCLRTGIRSIIIASDLRIQHLGKRLFVVNVGRVNVVSTDEAMFSINTDAVLASVVADAVPFDLASEHQGPSAATALACQPILVVEVDAMERRDLSGQRWASNLYSNFWRATSDLFAVMLEVSALISNKLKAYFGSS